LTRESNTQKVDKEKYNKKTRKLEGKNSFCLQLAAQMWRRKRVTLSPLLSWLFL
jgi:hypothetical protein